MDLDKHVVQTERNKRQELEDSWGQMKSFYKKYRDRLQKDPKDEIALYLDNKARTIYGDLYDAEFRGEVEDGHQPKPKPIPPAVVDHRGEEEVGEDENEGKQRQEDADFYNYYERHLEREKIHWDQLRAENSLEEGGEGRRREEEETRREEKEKERKKKQKGSNRHDSSDGPSQPKRIHLRPLTEVSWGGGSVWHKGGIGIGPNQLSSSPWFSSLDTGSPTSNYLLLAGVLLLLLCYWRRALPVLETSAQLLYLVPWLAHVLVWQAAPLPFHYILHLASAAATPLFRGLRDYVALPTARWLGRELCPVAYWTAVAVAAAWATRAVFAVVMWLGWPFVWAVVYTVVAAALVAGGWALQTYVVAPAARAIRERVSGPRVYWIAVAIFSIWAVYGALWLGSLWWWVSLPFRAPNPDQTLSLLQRMELDPGLNLMQVAVVRTVRDALGKHVNERLFEFFDASQWEKRFVDWFVDLGYLLRPCHYSNCKIPNEDW